MNGIRAKVLKHYHETAFGLPGLHGIPDDAFATDDFAEYAALKRILSPGATNRTLVQQSNRPEFAHLLDQLPPNPPRKSVEQPGWHAVRNAKHLDLRTAGIPKDVVTLLVDRCREVSGWEALGKLSRLDRLVLSLSTGEDDSSRPASRLSLTGFEASECSRGCWVPALECFLVRELDVTDYSATTLDVAMIAGQDGLEELKINVPLVIGLDRCSCPKLRLLFLERAMPNRSTNDFLARHAKPLSSLRLVATAPFGPELLPDLPKLERLQVPAYPEFKKQWIDWAVAHPEVGCQFLNLQSVDLPSKVGATSVAETYRDLTLLEIKKGSRTYYELSEDVGKSLPGAAELSNGDIEDHMRPLAKQARVKLTWSSEADTLVAQSDQLDHLRWLVDTLHSEFGGGSGNSPPRAAATKQSVQKRQQAKKPAKQVASRSTTVAKQKPMDGAPKRPARKAKKPTR